MGSDVISKRRSVLVSASTMLFLIWLGLVGVNCRAADADESSFRGHETTGPTRDVVELSERAIEAIGLQLIEVKKKRLPLEIVTMGAIEAMPTKSYVQHALLAGRIYDVNVEPGELVKRGQILTVLDSPEINRLAAETLNAKNTIESEIKTKKSDYAAQRKQLKARVDLARATFDRQTTLFNEKIGSRKELEIATAELKVAESQLENVKQQEAVELEALQVKLKVTVQSLINRMKQTGVSDEAVREMLRTENTILRVPVRSSRDGIVTEIHANPGETINDQDPLFEVLEIDVVWATADIYENDMDRVRAGQPVFVRANALPRQVFSGLISYVGSQVDPEKRILPVRVKINNPEGKLKPDMFVELRIQTQEPAQAIILPKEAVVEKTGHFGVFVEVKPGVYQLNMVEQGRSLGDEVEILRGLTPGQKVVSRGAFQLDAHLIKSRGNTDAFSHPTEGHEHDHDEAAGKGDEERGLASAAGKLTPVLLVAAMIFGSAATAVFLRLTGRDSGKREAESASLEKSEETTTR